MNALPYEVAVRVSPYFVTVAGEVYCTGLSVEGKVVDTTPTDSDSYAICITTDG